jgi:hypothetical protein
VLPLACADEQFNVLKALLASDVHKDGGLANKRVSLGLSVASKELTYATAARVIGGYTHMTVLARHKSENVCQLRYPKNKVRQSEWQRQLQRIFCSTASSCYSAITFQSSLAVWCTGATRCSNWHWCVPSCHIIIIITACAHSKHSTLPCYVHADALNSRTTIFLYNARQQAAR